MSRFAPWYWSQLTDAQHMRINQFFGRTNDSSVEQLLDEGVVNTVLVWDEGDVAVLYGANRMFVVSPMGDITQF